MFEHKETAPQPDQRRSPPPPGLFVLEPDFEASEQALADRADREFLQEGAMTEYARYQSAVNVSHYRMAELAAQIDENEWWQAWGHRSLENCISFISGVSMSEAKKRADVARSLKRFPRAREAFSKGKLSLDKMATFVRVADEDSEEPLLELALVATANQWSRIARAYRGVLRREQEAEEDERRRARRFLSYFFDEDGTLVIRGRLPAEEGATFVGAIEAVEKDLPSDQDAWDPPAARRADALAGVALASLGFVEPQRSSPPVPHLSVLVDAEVLAGGDGRFEIDGGPVLPHADALYFACDCTLLGLVQRDGQVVGGGRKQRKIPLTLRRALVARDETCKFPGCTARRFVQGHHLVHWANGGPTILENLVLLCSFHHRMLHRQNMRMERLDDGSFRFVREDGQVIPSGHDPPEADSDSFLFLRSQAIQVNREACIEDQDGGQLHLANVIRSLFHSIERQKVERKATA